MNEQGKRRGILSRLKGILRVYLISVGLFWTIIPLSIVTAVFSYKAFFEKAEKEDETIPATQLGENGRVTIELSEDLSEDSSMTRHFLRAFSFGHSDYSATSVHRILRAIATDVRVKELDLILDGASGEPSDILRWINDLKKIKEAGKKTRFWTRSLGNITALLASQFEVVAMPISGTIEIPGPILSQLYFGPALTKL